MTAGRLFDGRLAVWLTLAAVTLYGGLSAQPERPAWSGAAQLIYASTAVSLVLALSVHAAHKRVRGLPWVLMAAGAIVLIVSQLALVLAAGTVHGALVLAAFNAHPVLAVSGLAAYPLFYAGQMVLLSQRVRGVVPSSWLDGVLVCLFLAALSVAFLVPTFSDRKDVGHLAALALVLRPLLDVFMVTFAAANASLSGWRSDRRLPMLVGCFTVLTVCDALGVTRVAGALGALGLTGAADAVNPVVDAGRLLALLVLTCAARRPEGAEQGERIQAGWSSLAGPLLVLAGALAILASRSVQLRGGLAEMLALACVAGVGVKIVLIFAQVLRLLDSRRQALTDELTGLPNRRSFNTHLATALAQDSSSARPGSWRGNGVRQLAVQVAHRSPSSSGPGTSLALLLLDLDRFKEVNDRFGHLIGDDLLRVLAARLRSLLPTRAVLARLGGDEFAVVVCDQDEQAVRQLARDLVVAVREPVQLAGHRLLVGASIGLALRQDIDRDVAPRNEEHSADHDERRSQDRTAAELLRRADVAMYCSKAAGGGVSAYDAGLDRAGRQRSLLLEELTATVSAAPAADPGGPRRRNHSGGRPLGSEDTAEALDAGGDGGLRVFYQPQVDVRTGEVHGVEALVRWLHPRLGLLSPDAFLALAEDNGLIGAVTAHVLDAAAAQGARWHAAGHPLRVSVNLSTSCLSNEHLLVLLDEVLHRTGFDPTSLTLEITETSLMADTTAAIACSHALRERGIALSIDDYGTGYSSLAYLHDLPASELKIDRSFTTRLLHDPRAAAIVANTVDLAERLGLRLVAEGVEDVPTLQALSALGCDETQGYLHARPLTAEAMTTWLERYDASPQLAAPTRTGAPVSD